MVEELRRKPFLLVLDGFERVLTAYHRWDKAQQRDEQIETELRECTNPQDRDLLLMLRNCGPSKILVSTRLFPSDLEDRASHKPMDGVARLKLDGLAPADALALMRHAGVRGNATAMLDFAEKFGRHSLLLRIVCGMVADYRKQPYDFDAWLADPLHGGGLKLSEIELKQRYTHILHFALAGLSEPTRKLLARIAVISEGATYAILAVLNPFLPPQPEVVEEPSDPSTDWEWSYFSDEKKQQANVEYREAREKHQQYTAALRDYYDGPEYRRGMTAFEGALKELEDRGLLQWDRDSNRYEMHPVVRGHAAELLETADRTRTFNTVRDHFASLPPDDLEGATEVEHVAHSLEIYRCLVGADRRDEAASFYRGDLSRTLLLHVGAYSLVLELLKPLFRNNIQGLPCLASTSDQSYILNDLAGAYHFLGRRYDALELCRKALQVDLQVEDWADVATKLRNIAVSFALCDRLAEGVATRDLARELSEVADDQDGVTVAILHQMGDAIKMGRFAEAEKLAAEFYERPQPPSAIYRPGEAEYWTCRSQYYQGQLTDAEWQEGYDRAVSHRNIASQYLFLALRAAWDQSEDRPARALESITLALQITKKLGTPRSGYHDLRAWALARVGRPDDARLELQAGEQRLYAAETHLLLSDRAQARTCALHAYRWAWGEGPPYIRWFDLERSRALLRQLGEPEPELPPFDPAKVPPIPFEKEIRAGIEKLRAEKARRMPRNN